MSPNSKKSFIASVVPAAQKAQRSYGVPASVSIAQAILDSDWGTSSVARKAENYFDTRCSAAMTASQFASLADAQVGKPYVLGAEAAISNTDPAKFDCSELVQWLFGRSGNPITDLAASQYNVTKRVTGKPAVGDLVFLRNNPARSNGIRPRRRADQELANGDWRVIEARGRAYGVVRSTLSYWKHRSYYAGLRRYSSFVLAGSGNVSASAASIYQSRVHHDLRHEVRQVQFGRRLLRRSRDRRGRGRPVQRGALGDRQRTCLRVRDRQDRATQVGERLRQQDQ